MSERELPVAPRWWTRQSLADDVTLIVEPALDPFLRCNVWHVRGRDADLLVDTGMGVASLADEIADLVDRPLRAVATHYHLDHTGSLHEFAERLIHPSEAREVERLTPLPLRISDWPPEFLQIFEKSDYEMPQFLITAAPRAGWTVDDLEVVSTTATATIDEGDVLDLGDRSFEVLHLPGHSPGSIGLWEAARGILFSGDAVYDGPLLDMLPDSDIAAYRATMKRLLELPVDVVHGGHEPSFGRPRLREICRAYLEHTS
jgi:glyoxylase-like metal-dependent hydrolase (beta-lactamase superfamily II)